jgi:hypothetical protein
MILSEGRDRDHRVYACLFVATIILGLASRRFGHSLPHFFAEYAGDTLWAAMVFFGLAFLLPKKSTLTLAVIALVTSFAVEFSQLYRAPWIDAIRSNRVGALVLGQGFLWSDLLCYIAGVVLAALIDQKGSHPAQLP